MHLSPLGIIRRLAQGSALAAFALTSTALYAGTPDQDHRGHDTATPIKHVILILGENRTFDNVFATFQPDRHQRVWNLLSEGIVNADGTPGPNFARAQQWQASDTGAYSLHPGKTAPYVNLEPVTVSGAPSAPYFPSVAIAEAIEPALPASYYPFLVEGGTGLDPSAGIDTRFPTSLPNGPFDITAYHGYDAYDGSPVHR